MSPSFKNEPVQNFKDNIRDTVSDAQRDLRATANDAGQRARQFIDSTSEELSQAAERVAAHVNEKPMQSSLMALGIGFVLGILIRR